MSTTSTTRRTALVTAKVESRVPSDRDGRARSPSAPPQGDDFNAEAQRRGERGDLWFCEVPEGWKVKPLRAFLSPVSERNRPDEKLLSVTRDAGVIVRNTDSKEENHNYIPDDLSNYKFVAKGKFVINKMKAWQGSYGVSCYDGIVSPAYFVYSLDFPCKSFFNIAIRSKAYVQFFQRFSKGIRVDQWDLTPEALKTIPFAFPPLPEQEAIVRYLDETTGKIDKAIAAEERLIELLQERKQIIINEAVGGGLSREEAQRRRELPKGWEVKRLKSELLANDGGVWGDDPRGNERDTIVLRSTEQNVDGTLSVLEPAVRNLSEFERCKAWLQEGDLIVTKSSGSQEHIGKTSIIDKTVADKGCCYSNFLQRLRVKGKPKYFWYLLNGVITKRQIERMTTTTTGLKNLTGKILGNLEFLLPPLPEQEAIVKYLDEETGKIDRAIEVKRRQIALLRERREIIIDEVVTGKVKVA